MTLPSGNAQADRASSFLDLHVAGQPLLLPNAWDIGSLRMLEGVGFSAVATTSNGFAATLGRRDGNVSLAEAHAHSMAMVASTDLPVTSDYENGYADDPDGVAENAQLAVDAGLAGFSIEDYTGDVERGFYPVDDAAARVRAAVEVAHRGEAHVVVTARAESALYGPVDFDDIMPRVAAFQEVGADVIYVPGLVEPADIAKVVGACEVPVNVLIRPGGPDVSVLADLGVSRISVGGLFAFVGLGAAAQAAREFLDAGTHGFTSTAAIGGEATRGRFD